MGLSKPVVWILVLLLLGNIVLFALTIKSAEDVAKAQLQGAIAAADQPDQPDQREPPRQQIAAKPKPKPAAVAVEKKICRVLGPYERALGAAKVLNRLEQAGADTELLTSEELRQRQLLAPAESTSTSMYWVRAVQTGLLQGAKPEELANAKACR